jgi:hypothetical protein
LSFRIVWFEVAALWLLVCFIFTLVLRALGVFQYRFNIDSDIDLITDDNPGEI